MGCAVGESLRLLLKLGRKGDVPVAVYDASFARRRQQIDVLALGKSKDLGTISCSILI